jgi:signal transduction histidine kinase
LVYQGEPIGELRLGPRVPGEVLTGADRRLLEGLARRAGVATHAVQITADLQRARQARRGRRELPGSGARAGGHRRRPGVHPGAPSGVGLASMRERAGELGGSCVVESMAAGGTRIVARLPLSAVGGQ